MPRETLEVAQFIFWKNSWGLALFRSESTGKSHSRPKVDLIISIFPSSPLTAFWHALCHYGLLLLLLLLAIKCIHSNTLCSQVCSSGYRFGSRCIPDKLSQCDHVAYVGKKVYWIQKFQTFRFLVSYLENFFVGHISFFFKKQARSLGKQMTSTWG